jgi:ribosome biogenesis protein Nip4
MSDIPEELEVDKKFLPPRDCLIHMMSLFNEYRNAELFPREDENLENSFLSKEEKIYIRLNGEKPFRGHEKSFEEVKRAIENLKRNNNIAVVGNCPWIVTIIDYFGPGCRHSGGSKD